MTTLASPASLLTVEKIRSVVDAMPMHGRIMLRLILLQYFDVTDEENLYIDEDYAIERGVDPATLTRVEIPRDLFVSGTVQEIREYVALYLESRQSGTA